MKLRLLRITLVLIIYRSTNPPLQDTEILSAESSSALIPYEGAEVSSPIYLAYPREMHLRIFPLTKKIYQDLLIPIQITVILMIIL